ncbi:GNAT family N-acetyltransferase [Sphingomonas sp. CL5.1]|uniref:GNAT family N-acetyltransferase n=1 Tax=Sphingomonas sp. CL5.1 TaxID=2653203 RepID=UPI001583B833|nr:GNAT family N-acetyltransferase [Sphingomonas sp. CL5.1]QKR99415.1 GNAT family N-acetyltransferase [Sphingomonas sp. CL5.1]
MTHAAARAATARRWFRRLGHEAIAAAPGITVVASPAYPDTWDANFATADPGATPEALFAAIDGYLAHSPWRVVAVDALTDPAIEATLALAGHVAQPPLIEFIALCPLASRHPLPAIAPRAVCGEADWRAFATLVAIDHREGLRTGTIDPAVAAGQLEGMRLRSPPADYWLIAGHEGGPPLGYGMTLACPGNLGLIEHLFVLPEHRGKGVMSAFILWAGDRLRAGGCDALFIDVHAGAPPARLYASLGFVPVALTRNWVCHPNP